MRERFEQQMEILHTELIELGALCEQAIGRTYEVLLEGNQRAAEEIIKKDQVVDAKEREIEDLCFRIILQQQPVARDLRQVSAALKMITDMERIGDQTSDIAEIVSTARENQKVDVEEISTMATAVSKMVRDSVTAYVTKDLELAKNVILADDIVDEYFEEIKEKMIQYIKDEQGEHGKHIFNLIMVTKYLERIGDHATNIAEWVEFSITGVHRIGKVQKSNEE